MARAGRTEASGALGQIAEVLAAESTVRQRVESCRESLNRQIAEAQEWARALQRRTHGRLTTLHATCDRNIQKQIDAIRDRGRENAPPVDLDSADRDALTKTVEQLADQLIGRKHG